MGVVAIAKVIFEGAAVWRQVKPWRRLKAWRNERRARRGKPLLPITKDDDNMIPKNTLRKAGAGLVAAGPMIALVLGFFGVGECTPEMVQEGCRGANEMAGALISLAGGGVFWIGQNRAEKRLDSALKE